MTLEQVLAFEEIESVSKKDYASAKAKALTFAESICGKASLEILSTLSALNDAESLTRSLRVLIQSILPRQLRINLSEDEIVEAYTKAFDL